ncbi:MAG TPA: hypothetical protein VG713_22450 [Pirellulales bacterium]|nr:hypothetical protein [Pirellulales bacterium]
MNDRADKRRGEYRANMESTLDTIRAQSPGTEFIVVTSMLNTPKQGDQLEPILHLRDEALQISRAGMALVDMTSPHQTIIEHKNYLDTSRNGVNHPNDFLQRVYAQRVVEVLSP